VGKGTVVRRVVELVPNLSVSISVTTREPRESLQERDGVHYYFVDDRAFDRMVEAGELLEWAEVFGSRYGTPAEPIRRVLEMAGDAVLEIDVQGARQIRDAMPKAVLVFLEPPSLEELERRLRSRGTEDEQRLAHRLEKAGWELDQKEWFDHVVVNDDLDRASAQVAAIIEESRASRDNPSQEGS
jgi:guanylate kinase